MNNTAKTASAISNADDRNSAKAPDRPMLESSAAMPRPAAMPAMGPSQREAPLFRGAGRGRARRGGAGGCRRGGGAGGVAAGGRRRGGLALLGHVAGLTAHAAAAASAARLGVKRSRHQRRAGNGDQRCGENRERQNLVMVGVLLVLAKAAPRSAAPANFPYNNLNCIRITDKIPPHKFPVGKGSSEKVGYQPRRTPSCSAAMPAVRLKYCTRSRPAVRIMSAKVSWSGCMRIDSAR